MRGHKDGCSPSLSEGRNCECDSFNRSKIGRTVATHWKEMMEGISGWTYQDGDAPSFVREYEGGHIITLSRVYDGWHHRWQKKLMTITESSGFGTLKACLDDLWSHVFRQFDVYSDTMRDNIKLRTKQVTFTEEQEAWQANLPNWVYWTCEACGVTWKVSKDSNHRVCIRCTPKNRMIED